MHTIEIRQFGNAVASLPSANREISEFEFNLACAVADVLQRHTRLEMGYYEVVLLDHCGEVIDALESVA